MGKFIFAIASAHLTDTALTRMRLIFSVILNCTQVCSTSSNICMRAGGPAGGWRKGNVRIRSKRSARCESGIHTPFKRSIWAASLKLELPRKIMNFLLPRLEQSCSSIGQVTLQSHDTVTFKTVLSSLYYTFVDLHRKLVFS